MSKIIACPRCGESSRVLRVRTRMDGSVYRKRCCDACDLSFSSEERILGVPTGTETAKNVTSLIELLEMFESMGIRVDTTGVVFKNPA